MMPPRRDEFPDDADDLPEESERNEVFEPIRRLSRDLLAMSSAMTATQARYYVDEYYVLQEHRIRAAAQVREAEKAGEPTALLSWSLVNFKALEADLRKMLGVWANSQPMGVWARSVTGIGAVIAAGLLAHIDIERAPTVGHIWNLAGMSPDIRWEKGQKRPWNAELKRIVWHAGKSFMKFQNHPNDFYGRLYRERKNGEISRNLAGLYADQAAAALQRFRFGDDKLARLWYEGCLTPEAAKDVLALQSLAAREAAVRRLAGLPGSGVAMLPPSHIEARAIRWVGKLFLAHWHQVAFETFYRRAVPKPFVLAYLDHVDFIPPPNYDSPYGTGKWDGVVPKQTHWSDVRASDKPEKFAVDEAFGA
jgi:hypothetical protein